jgi:hypothetical protein
MNTEKLTELVGNSDLPTIQKRMLNGFIERSKQDEEKRQEDRLLIEQVARIKNLSEVIISADDVKIYSVRGNDEWDIKYPYRSILMKDGKWVCSNIVCPTVDTAYLVYLGCKYLGYNNEFSDFAIKMLEIDLSEQ